MLPVLAAPELGKISDIIEVTASEEYSSCQARKLQETTGMSETRELSFQPKRG